MQKVTEAYAKQVLESWDDYCYWGWTSKGQSSTGVLDAGKIVGAFGVSRSTAYAVKSRAEFLRKKGDKVGVGPMMESQDMVGVGTKSV